MNRIRQRVRQRGRQGDNIPQSFAWYDTSTSNYLTLDGTSITQFLDRSGNGNDTAVQGTGTAQPTWDDDGLNGKGVATFDGGDTLALPAALYSIPNGNNAVFAVAKRNTEAGVGAMILSFNEGAGSGGGREFLAFSTAAGNTYFQNFTADAGSGCIVTGGTNTNYNIFSAFRSGTTQSLSRNDGTTTANTAADSEIGIDRGYIGAMDATNRPLTGGIAEILIYNRALSAAEITQVEIYLANKWGIYHPQASWINSYPDYMQDLIHVFKINKADVGANTTGNPIAAYWNPNAQATGAMTSLTDYGRGVNTATEATNPPINTANSFGSVSGLVFDGADTVLGAGSDSSIDNIFAAGGSYFGVVNVTSDGGGNRGRIWQKDAIVVLSTTDESAGDCKIEFTQAFSTTNGVWALTNRDIALGETSIIGMTYNSAATTNNPSVYVNSATAKAVTESSTPVGTASSDASDGFFFGNNGAGTRGYDGIQGEQLLTKTAMTSAQITDLMTRWATRYGVTLA